MNRNVILFSILVVALVALGIWWMSSWQDVGSLVVKNTGTNTVLVRALPRIAHPGFGLNLQSRPPKARFVPLDTVILNQGVSVTQRLARGARIEICTDIPSTNVFQGVPQSDGVIWTTSFSPETTNLPFRTMWQGNARRLEVEVNGNVPTNGSFRVMRLDK
jgi:hypothetical protein